MKQWAVFKYANNKFKIVADYGDYTWNSPSYELIGYFKSRKFARLAILELLRQA